MTTRLYLAAPQVAKDLKASFKQSSWALAEGTAAAGGVGGEGPTAAGVPPEIYTTALRAALIEYGGNPVATLPDRLRAADSLAAFLGMSGGAHETLMLRALAANESLVYELQVGVRWERFKHAREQLRTSVHPAQRVNGAAH